VLYKCKTINRCPAFTSNVKIHLESSSDRVECASRCAVSHRLTHRYHMAAAWCLFGMAFPDIDAALSIAETETYFSLTKTTAVSLQMVCWEMNEWRSRGMVIVQNEKGIEGGREERVLLGVRWETAGVRWLEGTAGGVETRGWGLSLLKLWWCRVPPCSCSPDREWTGSTCLSTEGSDDWLSSGRGLRSQTMLIKHHFSQI